MIQLFDATTHPVPNLLPHCRRLWCVGSSTPDAKVIEVDGRPLQPWLNREKQRIDWNTLKDVLSTCSPHTPVSLNLEPPRDWPGVWPWPVSRRIGSQVYDVEPYKAVAMEFYRLAKGFGLTVFSPFELLTEGERVLLEANRLARDGWFDRSEIGMHHLVRCNNDELRDVFDFCDAVLCRAYVSRELRVDRVREVTRGNIGEARRMNRGGKPIIVIVRGDTLTEREMDAQARVILEEKADGVAFWEENPGFKTPKASIEYVKRFV